MTNALYDHGREAFLCGDIDWLADNIRVCLIDTDDYTVDLATDQFLADIAGIVSTSGNLTNKSATAGVADADDATFSAVTGDECEALVIYQDTGDAETSRLIAYIDTASSGLPVTPNGGDIVVVWDNGTNKIFKL